jgi:predicted phosphodiesterase
LRFLILSDIHANVTALQAAIAAVEGRWDRALCLGDVVGYGPDPNEALDLVRTLNPIMIRGNHDKAACGITDASDFNPVARIAAEWTTSQLRPENLQLLLDLPMGPVVVDDLAIVHGAVADEDEYVFAPALALDGIINSPAALTFFGHTHFQGGFSYRGTQLEVIQLKPPPGANFSALQLEEGTRYLLNPGSIGQPRDGDPRAGFAIADMGHHVTEFWRVPYDIPAVQARMREAKLPEVLVQRLTFGR